MMRQAVVSVFPTFSKAFEGYIHSFYLDVKGLVTTGVGNLIDTPEEARKLPWKHPDGRLASGSEITAAWHAVKAAQPALHWKLYEHLTDLRLTDSDIDALVIGKLASNADYIKLHHFPGWDDFPADAQLGIMSMAWACGPGFPHTFVNFATFAARQHWGSAGLCCKIHEEGNPGVVPRNHANALCFENAAIVQTTGLDPEILNWPAQVVPPVTITPGGDDGTS